MSDFVDQIRARVDITEVIGDYTPLSKKGKDWRGPCPLHNGKNPASFAVNPERGFFKCFSGCLESGDVFDFIMKAEGVDFMGACRILAARVGVEIPERRARLTPEQKRRREAQGEFRDDSPGWDAIGITNSVTAYQLGARSGSDPHLLLPVWGNGDGSSSPGGWLAFRPLQTGVPEPLGLDPLSRDGLRGELYIPPAALAAARQRLLLFVVDPIVCLRLNEAGYRASFSTIDPERREDDPWITTEQAAMIQERAQGRLERMGLLVPFRHSDPDKRAALLQALHRTEVILLKAGIEPILVSIDADPTSPEPFGWSWLDGKSSDDVTGHLSSDRTAFDVYDLRVSLVADRVEKGVLTADQAIEKLVPSLRAAKQASALLYECYVAWTVHCVRGVHRAALESGVLLEGEEAVRF